MEQGLFPDYKPSFGSNLKQPLTSGQLGTRVGLLSKPNYTRTHFLRASVVTCDYVGGLKTGELFGGSDLTSES